MRTTDKFFSLFTAKRMHFTRSRPTSKILLTAWWVADIYVAYTYDPNYKVLNFSCLLLI